MKPGASVIYTPASWVETFDWPVVFGNHNPVEIEIGCGKGAFLTWAARTQPGTNFLGVDRQLGRLRSVERKARRFGLTNVRLVHIEASYLVGRLVPSNSVSAYHIFFPDPWPKRRHHQRRLFLDDFVAALARTLNLGGSVNLATDSADYFAWIGDVMSASAHFAEAQPVDLPPESRSEFERVFLALAKPICRKRWLRRTTDDISGV